MKIQETIIYKAYIHLNSSASKFDELLGHGCIQHEPINMYVPFVNGRIVEMESKVKSSAVIQLEAVKWFRNNYSSDSGRYSIDFIVKTYKNRKL